MEHPSTPAGGQPANLPAETSATRSGVIRMSVHIPDNWNPHADLLAIADLAAAAGKRADRFTEMAAEAEQAGRYQQAEDYRQAARESITRENVREINFAVCLLAMRLSGCRITLPAAEAEQESAEALRDLRKGIRQREARHARHEAAAAREKGGAL